MRMRSGWWRGSICWVLLFWGRFSVSKPLSQKHGSTFLPLQVADPTPSFGGFGLRWRPYGVRGFLVFPHPRHCLTIRRQVNALLAGPWGQHFEELDEEPDE